MNKVSVELGMNVKGFVDGISQATDSTKVYESETRKVRDSLGNFKKEFGAARREVMNLASAYSKLDATAKASQFGKEMARQLEEAKKKASEMLDMQGDLNQELKNMASDTRVFDTLTEGMGVFMNTTSAALGIVAQFTGNEKDAQRAIVAFTTAQSVLQAATKIQNALQMQSNLMLAVNAVRNKAAAAAVTIKTAAENRGVAVTKAATVAQIAFNAIAKANPYVLLATAILTVVSALSAFIIFSKKAEAQERAEAEERERAKAINDSYYDAYNQKMGETMSSYVRLQGEWKNLKTEGEKNKWIKDNEDAFHALGFQIDNTSDAENIFVQNEQAVIDSFDARARAAAYAAQMVEVYNQALKSAPKAGDKISIKEAAKYGISEKGHKVDTHLFDDNEITVTKADEEKIRKAKMDEAKKTSKELASERVKAEKEAEKKATNGNIKEYKKGNENKKQVRSSVHKDNKKDIHKNSLEEAEEEVRTWETALKQANIDDKELIKNIQSKIEGAKKKVEERKLQLGIEVKSKNEKTKTQSDVLSDYEKQLKTQEAEAAAAMVLAQLHHKDALEIENLTVAWEKAKKAREDYEGIKKMMTEGVQVEGNKKTQSIMSGETPKTVSAYEDAISVLQDKIDNLDFSTSKDQLDEYAAKIVEMKMTLEEMGEDIEDALLTPTEKATKDAQKMAKNYNIVADAVSSVGEAFSALGELAEDDPALNIMGIVAQAVANVLAGYAQATVAAAQSGNPWVWAAFAAAGLAQTLAMVAQIKSAASYDSGGIIGGSSYHGDRVLAHVESGEMILNQRQQRNLFNLLDQDVMPQRGGMNVTVSGVVRGTDLLLVQQNTNKIRSKTGTQIHF